MEISPRPGNGATAWAASRRAPPRAAPIVGHVLGAFILSAGLLTSIGPGARAGEQVRVGIHENAPVAFLDRDGRPQGLCIDLLRHAADREGWALQYVPLSRAEALARLERGEIDLIPGLARSDELAGRFDFGGTVVLRTWLQVYVPKGAHLESALGLAGKKVALVRDSAGQEIFRKDLARYGVQCSFQEAADYAEVFRAVSSGRADAGLVSRTYGASHGRYFEAEPAPILVYLQEVHFAATKGRGGRLLEALDRRGQALMSDRNSLYYQSLGRWLGNSDGTPAWFYVLLCVAAPPLWALLTYFVFGLVQRRLSSKEDGAAAPAESGR